MQMKFEKFATHLETPGDIPVVKLGTTVLDRRRGWGGGGGLENCDSSTLLGTGGMRLLSCIE